MRKGITFAVVGGFLLLAMNNLASAQDDATGPLKLSLGADAAFIDNRDSTAAGLEESNTDIYIKPRVDAIFDWGDSMLDFFWVPTYRYRTDAGDFQETSKLFQDFGLHGRHALSQRLSVRLKEVFKYTDDPTLASGGVNVTREGTYFLNNLSGGLSLDVAPNSRFDFDVNWDVKEFDEDVFDYLNEDSVEGDLAFRQKVSRTVTVLAQAKARDFSYGEITGAVAAGTTESSDRDFTSVSGGLGIETEFSPVSKLSAYAGYITIDFSEDTMDKQDSPYASIILTHQLNPSTVITAASLYGLRETAIRSYSVQEYSDVRADIYVDVSKSVTLGAGGLYRYSKYNEDGITPAGEEAAVAAGRSFDGKQTTIIAHGSAAYKMTEDAVLKLLYRFTTDESDVSNDFDKNTVVLSFVQNF
ncbi:MAG: outer membrane beta-barrel protein [Kiritimatiellae bacterium]|nr:outer membrane beta-barrel protein [Kiritimatiellia bacterium]